MFEIVKYLVENGADLHKTSNKDFIEELARRYRFSHIVKYLIENNAKYDFETIVYNCVMTNNLDMLEWLITKKLKHRVKVIASCFDEQNST